MMLIKFFKPLRAKHLELGALGEKVAVKFFKARNAVILARNWRNTFAHDGSGELDIVLLDGETLVFAEVKTRSKVDNYQPEANLDNNQKARIRRGARAYCRKFHIADEVSKRFDLVEVIHDGKKLYSITLHENYMAFSQAEFLTDPQVESIL